MSVIHVSTPVIPDLGSLEVIEYLSMQSQQHISMSIQKINIHVNKQAIHYYLYLKQIQVFDHVFGLMMGSIIKLRVQVCNYNYSPCIIRYRLLVSEVLQVCHVHIVCALVSEECDTHQVGQIDVDYLVTLLLHLRYVTSCFLKMLLENSYQPSKMFMSTNRLSHLVLNCNHIILQ